MTTETTDLGVCLAPVYDPGVLQGRSCTNKAWALGDYWGKQVPLCKVHHPMAREERRKARGPTRFEQRLLQRERQNAELAALKASHERLYKALDQLWRRGPISTPEAREAEAALEAAWRDQWGERP